MRRRLSANFPKQNALGLVLVDVDLHSVGNGDGIGFWECLRAPVPYPKYAQATSTQVETQFNPPSAAHGVCPAGTKLSQLAR